MRNHDVSSLKALIRSLLRSLSLMSRMNWLFTIPLNTPCCLTSLPAHFRALRPARRDRSLSGFERWWPSGARARKDRMANRAEIRARVREQVGGPGGFCELVVEDVLGHRLPVFKNRKRSLRELLASTADREAGSRRTARPSR